MMDFPYELFIVVTRSPDYSNIYIDAWVEHITKIDNRNP